ncbi:MAG: hypothetical protein V9E90_14270 [Saprospiraceae bacterium]
MYSIEQNINTLLTLKGTRIYEKRRLQMLVLNSYARNNQLDGMLAYIRY